MSKCRKRLRFKYETPEGGWGYLICVGTAIAFYVTIDIKYTYGLIFNDFLKSLDSGTSITPVLHGCFYIAYSITGLLYYSIIRTVTIRTAGVLGGFLYTASGIFHYFAENVTFLYVAAFVQGHALGLIFLTLFSSINFYFVKKRAFVISLTLLAAGLGPTFVPLFVYYIFSNYGFRGCLLILIGIYAHNILVTLLAHPVEWHSSRILLETTDDANDQKEMAKSKSNTVSNESYKESLQKGNSYELRSFIEDSKQKDKQSATYFGRFIDIDLLKRPTFVSMIVGIAFSFYAFSSFMEFTPTYLLELNFSKAEASQISSIYGVSDFIARGAYVFVTMVTRKKSRYIFWYATVVGVFAQFGLASASSFSSVSVLSAVMSFCHALTSVSMAVILAESVPQQRFPAGYGIFTCLQGATVFLNGIVARFIHKTFNTFSAVYLYQNIFLVISALLWLFEFIWLRCTRKNNVTCS